MNKENTTEKGPDKAELLCFGGVAKEGGLQNGFAKFRKAKVDEIKYRNYVAKQTKVGVRDQAFKDNLRAKFLETVKKYFGVPYAKRYWQPGEELYDSPIFLDCCALVRQAVFDLRDEFGFQLDRWNQAYQYDTLPIDLSFEQLKPGDLVFYSGTYYNTKLRAQKHDMVHVEVFTGGETGEQSIGARWQRGVVKYFDSYKFESKSYHSIKFHYKSIDTWLDGICKSHCDVHKWSSANLQWAPGKNSIFALEEGYDEADIDAPMLDDEETLQPLDKLMFLGLGNNPKLVKEAMVELGYKQMVQGMQFSDLYRFKWVQTPSEINYLKFVEGRHIANHFSNANVLTRKISTIEQIQTLGLAMRSRSIEEPYSHLFKSTSEFMPATFRLDVVADLVAFLNTPDEGLWMVKHSNSNQGKGVEMCADIAQFKKGILTGQDKWADNSGTDNNQAGGQVMKKDLKYVVQGLQNVMVQKYLETPCLFKGRKFDIRAFMVVICAKPYFVYSHPGYTRISLEQFHCDDFGEKTQEARVRHLTNLAIQKKSPKWKDNKNDTVTTWEQLAAHLVETGYLNTVSDYQAQVTPKINEVMRLMFLQFKDRLDRKFGCFEIFGFDFMLDRQLQPQLLEINMNPAMFLDTKTMEDLLPTLISDCCRMAVNIHTDHAKESSAAVIRDLLKTCKLPYDVLYQE